MALRDRWDSLWSSERDTGGGGTATLTLDEFTSNFDVVHFDDTPGKELAIVTARQADVSRKALRELGTSSPSPWTSFTRQEYNPNLFGLKGLEVFDRMRKSDGTVRGTLRTIKTPALSGRWFVEPAQHPEATDADVERYKMQARFIWCNLTEWMSISWPQVLTECMLMMDFGYYMWEKVWENRIIDGELRTVLAKLGPRHPMDVLEWKYDAHGGPVRVHMQPPSVGPLQPQFIPIDIEKLLVFTFDREAGNIEGISVLRSAYKHWYFMEQLYKIDAIQKERHGIGIPVVELPMGFKEEDKALAENLAANIRTNDRAHIVLPPNWKLYMLKLEGQPVDALDSIEMHQAAIRENILANFITEGAREEDLTMFLKASRFIADIVSETFNTYLIPQMIRFNWPLEEYYPKLRVRRVGESADWRTLSFAIRNLIGAGVIIPDRVLEDNLREEMDLPAVDEETSRLIATPQNPYDAADDELEQDQGVDQRAAQGDNAGDNTHNQNNPQYNRGRKRKPGRRQNTNKNIAGLPRQTTVSRMRRGGPFGTPRRDSGTDRGGNS